VDSIIAGSRGGPAGRRGAAPAVKLVRDPVCGTYVPPRAALSVTASGATHYFCSERCLNEYQERA
jgi:YHS domain-containing protein